MWLKNKDKRQQLPDDVYMTTDKVQQLGMTFPYKAITSGISSSRGLLPVGLLMGSAASGAAHGVCCQWGCSWGLLPVGLLMGSADGGAARGVCCRWVSGWGQLRVGLLMGLG